MLEVKRILSKFLLIMFALNCMNSISHSKYPAEFSKVYEGALGVNMESRNVKIRIANLSVDEKDNIVVKSDSAFTILKFNGEDWEFIYKIDINTNESDIKVWTTGDLDNDKKDEIIIFKGKNIVIYNLTEQDFIKSTHDFPYYVESALVGDIDNDNLNELLLFCCEEASSYERFGCKYYLCVVKYDGQKINIFWSDSQRLRFEDSGIVPPDKLVCIADIENKGNNQLVVTGGQSDVSPTNYGLLNWVNGGLERTKSFSVSKGAIRTGNSAKDKPMRKNRKKSREEKFEREEIHPFLIGGLKATLIDGKTILLGTMVDKDYKRIPAIIEIKENNIKIENLTYIETHGWYPLNMLLWANIDGYGRGILRINKRHNSNIAKFKFYR